MLSYFLNSVLHSFVINSVTLLSSMLSIVYILILENVMKIRVVVDTVLTRENLELSGLGTLLKNTTLISYRILDISQQTKIMKLKLN